MMKLVQGLMLAAVVALGTSGAALADEDDYLRLQSTRSFDETVTHLRNGLIAKGFNIFAEINHADAAKKVGLTMPPTKVLVFGNPKAGTPLMLEHPDVALDLPLKVLVRQKGDKVDVLMHKANELDIPDEVSAKLAPAEQLVRSLVQGD